MIRERKIKKLWYFITGTGLFIIIIFLLGAFHGRFNFKYETVVIQYSDLPAQLEGFTIVHVSDMHLKSFKGHKDKLIEVIDSINKLNADIIVNTGDFVSYTWEEMEPFTGIFSNMESMYGNYAIPGNHDSGLYHSIYKNDIDKHISLIKDMISKSGSIYLNNTSSTIIIDTIRLSVLGAGISGRIPNVETTKVEIALNGIMDSDFRILLSHDPNHWLNEIESRNDIDLTLSGHTHGMQFGIMLDNFKWSPAKLLFPAWNGLYGENGNYLYVNRGLGTVGPPVRIGMPPEITIIKLTSHPGASTVEK